MSDAESIFLTIGNSMPEAVASQMFGKKCFKFNGKAFICFFQDCMVFKLPNDQHSQAIALDGAKLFDPSGKGRPMKEWVQVPFEHAAFWPNLATHAQNYVSGE